VGAEYPWGTWFFPGNGDGTFGDAVESSHSVITEHMVAGDLNEDGHLDLVAVYSGGDVVTLLGDGQGHFQEGQYTYLINAGIQQIGLADLDPDGHLDVCFADVYKFAVFLFHGNGDGTLLNTQDLGIGYPVEGAAIADFDQNGAPDIAVGGGSVHQGLGSAVLLYNLINAQVAVETPTQKPEPPLRLMANPARGKLNVQFNLETAERVRVEVFDLSGRRVAVPMDGMLPAGAHTVSWRGESTGGRPAPPGVYVIRMVAEGKSRAVKAIWLRD
jgi:FG-GAP-like repeat/FlgD Ig-like domain